MFHAEIALKSENQDFCSEGLKFLEFCPIYKDSWGCISFFITRLVLFSWCACLWCAKKGLVFFCVVSRAGGEFIST